MSLEASSGWRWLWLSFEFPSETQRSLEFFCVVAGVVDVVAGRVSVCYYLFLRWLRVLQLVCLVLAHFHGL